MTLPEFEASLSQTSPPNGLAPTLEALWLDRKGKWERAHEIAQDIRGADGAWVHAYLHRREGDQSNAAILVPIRQQACSMGQP